MIDDVLFKGLKGEKLFTDVEVRALDCGLYYFVRDNVTYMMERYVLNDGVYFNVVAALRKKYLVGR